MRAYKPKDDVQKKSYFNDRFYVTPNTPKEDVSSDEIFSSDLEKLSSSFKVEQAYIELGHLVVYVDPHENYNVIEFFRDKLGYDFLMELSAIDYIKDRDGFEIFYEMLSTSKHKRARVKCFLKKGVSLRSVEKLFKMANFAEREMYDMFGMKIINHSDMRRILMPDDWYDYPLLKTYPLIGDEVASWYEVDKIFGKEARDIIGPEIRDCAAVDRYDTKRFARLGHEVPYGVDITDGKEPEHTPLGYQEEGGVKLFGKRLVKDLDEDKSEVLDERR